MVKEMKTVVKSFTDSYDGFSSADVTTTEWLSNRPGAKVIHMSSACNSAREEISITIIAGVPRTLCND